MVSPGCETAQHHKRPLPGNFMNEFLTNLSSDHTLLWALSIIFLMAASAVGLHFFWTAVFRSVAALRGITRKSPRDGN